MPSYRNRNGKITVSLRKSRVIELIGKPITRTFDSIGEAKSWAEPTEKLIVQGIIPADLLPKISNIITVSDAIRTYRRNANLAVKVQENLDIIDRRIGNIPLLDVSPKWIVGVWVKGMALEMKLKPGTIRHYVSAMRGCFDWLIMHDSLAVKQNPFRQLPFNYSVVKGGDLNNARERRLEPGEESRIEKRLAEIIASPVENTNVKHPEAFRVLFRLALETAMRMREMYTLKVKHVDLKARTIYLFRTKNGANRQVPLSSVAVRILSEYMLTIDRSNEENFIFPWYGGIDGDIGDCLPCYDDARTLLRKSITSKLSRAFISICDEIEIDNLHFHDLRHEAICRLYERTNLTDLQISKISGHKKMEMLSRYANLRASDLAASLW